jgi:hypothetical protein
MSFKFGQHVFDLKAIILTTIQKPKPKRKEKEKIT